MSEPRVPPPLISTALLRFVLGLGLGLGASFLIFRRAVFVPGSPLFQCVTIGALLAGMLALMRSDRQMQAAALAVAFALVRLGFVQSEGWVAAVAGALHIGGVYLVALIFDLLARRGILFGKFLVLGPLLAGVYLATGPLALFLHPSGAELMPELMRRVFLGLLIGDAVGFGVEVADLVVLVRVMRQQRPDGSSG